MSSFIGTSFPQKKKNHDVSEAIIERVVFLKCHTAQEILECKSERVGGGDRFATCLEEKNDLSLEQRIDRMLSSGMSFNYMPWKSFSGPFFLIMPLLKGKFLFQACGLP